MPINTAQSLLSKYWNRALPVDPKVIAETCGVTVSGLSLGSDSESSHQDLSGSFDLEEGRKPIIRFNENESSVRQRFTIAHELGHYALSHGSAFRDSSKSFSLNNYDWKEVEANKFAAELLMPADAVKQLITVNDITELDRLAKKFHVSEVAMKFRLKNLGWL